MQRSFALATTTVLSLCMLMLAMRTNSSPDVIRMRLSEQYDAMPQSFEANRGQTDAQVKFLSRGPGYTLFLTSTEAVLALTRRESPAKAMARPVRIRSEKSGQVAGSVLRMTFDGANPAPRVSGLDEQQSKANYFSGNDPTRWRSNVPTYARVQYEELYPGIDLLYYGSHHQLEYDFVVRPDADLNRIALSVVGADSLEVDAQGDLVLRTGAGVIRQRRPIIYQERDGHRVEIPGGYVLRGRQRVGFEVADYDRSRPLVIDPTLTYSTYLGGSELDLGIGIAVDALGSAYVTGWTTSTNFPTTTGALQATRCGSSCALDAFVTKLNPAGSGVVYSTYLGGSIDSVGWGIAADSLGNAYVTGYTYATDFPTTPGAFQTTAASFVNAFVAKLNPAGSGLVYSSYLGGSGGQNFGLDIKVDIIGNAYVAGHTESTSFPTTSGAFQATLAGFRNAFVTKLNPAGSGLVYSSYLGGSGGDDESRGIAVDTMGNAYVTGVTNSIDFPTTPGAFQTIYTGGGCCVGNDAFVAKVNSAGALVYSTYLGGSGGAAAGYGIAVNALGNVWVTGVTSTTDFPTTTGAFQTTPAGPSNAFVTKLNHAGSGLVYSTYLGGSFMDYGLGVAVDVLGNAYVMGRAGSTNFPTTPGALQSAFGGDSSGIWGDTFVAKFADVVFPDVLYGVNSSDDGLSIIDTNTGQTLFLGPLSSNPDRFTTPTAMAVRPSDKKLFVWNNSAMSNKTGELLTVDTCTARGTAVSPPTPSQGVLGALAFAPDGTLFGADEELSRIDPSTGVRTVIGLPFGARIDGLDFTPDGRLYGVELAFSRQRLFIINTTNGVATIVGTLSENIGIIGSIVFNPVTAMFLGSSFAGPNGETLFDLNPSDGVVSNVRRITPSTGFFSGAPQGLGFVPSCISLPVRVILSFFDAAVASGRLQGNGNGNSGNQHLTALRNLISSAGDLLIQGKTVEACAKLKDALERTDGNPQPPDFVTGPAALELAQRLTLVRSNLGCT